MSKKPPDNACLNSSEAGPDRSLLHTAAALCDPENAPWCELCNHSFIKQKKGSLITSDSPSHDDTDLEISHLDSDD